MKEEIVKEIIEDIRSRIFPEEEIKSMAGSEDFQRLQIFLNATYQTLIDDLEAKYLSNNL